MMKAMALFRVQLRNPNSSAPLSPALASSSSFTESGALKAVQQHCGSAKVNIMPKPLRQAHTSMPALIFAKASDKETVEEARKRQLDATELLAEMLNSDNPECTAELHLDSLTEEFFLVASTYLCLARKEGNAEVVSQLESTLKAAQKVKERTLRPEIQLLNQLLRDKGTAERRKTIENNKQYLNADSYFFQLLGQMIHDVEKQHGNPQSLKLLTQLRMISSDTKDFRKSLKKGR
ncbi:hypothetical protein O6H91_21G058300 [Diphasiastrum complanatum]|uniref:Uncharacterized protein n=1 Tax=Diphasiastrum complanatum TaxID=34168 RepID=A0ACC2AKT0_DIPCM|nr:hypothetical protein O6H91_21G058300 [Diphasiastrum complanatum]